MNYRLNVKKEKNEIPQVLEESMHNILHKLGVNKDFLAMTKNPILDKKRLIN